MLNNDNYCYLFKKIRRFWLAKILQLFSLNGNTKGFHLQSQKLELRTKTWYHVKVLLKRFHLNGNTTGFHPRTQKLELHTKKTVLRESTAEEVSFEW